MRQASLPPWIVIKNDTSKLDLPPILHSHFSVFHGVVASTR